MTDRIFATNGNTVCVIMTAMGEHFLHENAPGRRRRKSLADCSPAYGRYDLDKEPISGGKEINASKGEHCPSSLDPATNPCP